MLGRAVGGELLSNGCNIRIFDLTPPTDGIKPGMEYLKGSVLDKEAVDRAVKGCTVVHHLAASMPQAALTKEGFWEINVGGTMNVAKAAVRHGVKRIVFASTIEIYGLHYPEEFPVTEESEKRFTGIYSRNKLECEERLLELRDKEGIEVAFPRMPMIFGPGFYHEPSMKLLFRLIRRGLPVPVVASADAPWASVASFDAGVAFRLCAEREEADGEAFNIAALDAPHCVDALNDLILRAGSRSRLVKVPVKWTERVVSLMERYPERSPTPAELARFALTGGVYSIEKARSTIGYEPGHSAVDAMFSAYRYLHPG